MSKEFNEEEINSSEVSENDGDYAYKNVIKDKQQRRTWSVASFFFALLSLLFAFFLTWGSWVSLVLGVVSVGCSAVSRKNLGYFDKFSLAAMFIAIFGIVFALSGIIFGDLLAGIF